MSIPKVYILSHPGMNVKYSPMSRPKLELNKVRGVEFWKVL